FPLATSVPKPLQQPHPPIWVATRDPGSFDWAVGIGANILSTPLSAPPSEVAVLGEKFRKAVADHPEQPRPRFMMQRRTCVYDRAQDWEVAVRHSVDYGRTFENLMQNIGTVTNGFPEAVPYEIVANRANYDPANLRDNLMFGTPDEVIRKLQIYEDQGVDQFCLGLSFNLPFELQRKTLRLFIDEVMPHFAARERDRQVETTRVPARRSARSSTGPVTTVTTQAGDDRTLSVRGIEINYRLQGEGPRALICIHGVGSCLEAWDGVAARLGDAFRLLRFDL